MNIINAKLNNNGKISESELQRIYTKDGELKNEGTVLQTSKGNYEIEVSELYNGNTSSNNVDTTMPQMEGITHYFDNNNFTDTSKWENQIDNTKNASMVGAQYNETEKAIQINGTVDSMGTISNLESNCVITLKCFVFVS